MVAFKLALYIIVLCKLASSARILGLYPVPSLSHQVVYRALSRELARRGHEVTIITPDPIKNHGIPDGRFKQIDVRDISYKIWLELINFAKIRNAHDTPKVVYPIFKDTCIKILDEQLKTPEVKAILNNSTEQFDLLLMESLVPATFGLAWEFRVPYIGLSPMSGTLDNFDSLGSPTHPVFYPDMFRVKIGELNIWDKLNALYSDTWIRYQEYSLRERDNAVAKKWFGNDSLTVRDLESKMDLLFLNVYPLLAGVRPTLPSIVYTGGVHLNPRRKLPEDLQIFLDESPEGVVYMSLGCNVMSKDLPPQTVKMILEVFRDLPYRVLWKFEEDLPNKPRNVMTLKWFPQQDLLGHPNIKIFITQGGQQSMEEAIRDHVPLIGIPFMADQDLNVQIIIQLDIGIGLNINTLKKDVFQKAIMTVTNNSKYKRNIKRLSELLTDQPMTGLERAVWWTEYVLRHGGAQHLRAPAAGLSLVEYFLLDIIAVLLAIVAATVLAIAFLGKVFYKRLCRF